jgi:hypothetical protein
MTGVMRRWVGVLGVAVAAACASAAPGGPPVDAAGARALWEARGPESYAYTLEISCFCIHRGSYAVEVREGEIADVRDATTKVPSPESRVEWIVTVDRLFEVMALAASAGTPVRAEFHPELGHPVEAEVGLLANDSGTLYLIRDLRAL